jgi:ParB family chromosome partitioning protein
MPKKVSGLGGRGVSALFGEENVEAVLNDKDNALLEISINKIDNNKEQPRKNFDEESLRELADSIKEVGILQPLTVKEVAGGYEIIAGERRWRAARLAGLSTVPVIVKKYSELEAVEAALIENLQRVDLNPLEEAQTYKRLSAEFNLNQEEIASRVGKSRAVVANAMRLLNLDSRVQDFVREGRLSNGHARALLGISDENVQYELAEKIIEEELSVRQTEDLVKEYNTPKADDKQEVKKGIKDPEAVRAYFAIAKDLKNVLGAKVNIKNGKNKGKIEIEYYSDDELERLVGLIKSISY